MKTSNNQNPRAGTLPRDLGDGLILRRAAPADVEALADFNAQIHRDRGMEEPNPRVRAWVQDLMSETHPTFRPEDFTLVEDTRTGAIVSSLNLISQTWAYEGIPFEVGRPELVGTHPDYRRRGLVRAQFEAIHRLSAERGEVVQAITGIPNYYRQFGYEMTMTLGGGRIGHKSHVPELKEDESELFRVRPATEDDLRFIAGLYERIADRQPVHCLRDEARWRYELNGRSALSDSRRLLRVIESDVGESVGFLTHTDWLWGKQMWLSMYELKQGASWSAVTPSVIRYLWTTGEAYAARDERECQGFAFGLGEEHPAYTVFASRLPEIRAPYAWYIRVADVAGFLRHVAPALERRLVASDAAGYSGEIKVSFYRSGLLLKLEQGRLTEVADWSPEPSDWGNAAFPGMTFLHLLFGYRNCDELWHIFRDCWTDNSEIRSVMDRLFPKRPSCVWPLD
jgi:hypothetical protein